VNATEMDQQPLYCAADEAPLCEVGSTVTLFRDDFENTSSGNWTHGAIVGTDEWYYPQTDSPYIAEWFDPTYSSSGQYNVWGYAQDVTSDSYMAMTLDVPLPATLRAYLYFRHAYSFEYGFEYCDGGVIEYSTDGGSTWIDAGALIVDNGYTGTLSTEFNNPLGGRDAFGGHSNGYISTRLDLSPLAGEDVRFRFRIGTDESFDDYGWFIDDVHIYICGGIHGDFDGDHQADVAVYHSSSGLWFVRQSSDGSDQVTGYGGSNYVPVPGDYDGDMRRDTAVYHPSSGLWYIKQSSDGTDWYMAYGGADYMPVPGDYDGDGITDIAVYHALSGLWYYHQSSDGQNQYMGFGGSAYSPVPEDYDGDGKTDIAVYHAASGLWFIYQSSQGLYYYHGYGGTDYVPVAADYDGDGKADIAVYHPSSGLWYYHQSSDGADYYLGFGGSGYAPVPADYDGDGKADIAVYHASSGLWYMKYSSDGTNHHLGYGGSEYTPVNLNYLLWWVY